MNLTSAITFAILIAVLLLVRAAWHTPADDAYHALREQQERERRRRSS